MSLRSRMLLFTSLLLAGAVLVTASVLTWNARQSMLDDERESGQILARVLAHTSYIVEDFPAEMEGAIADQMVTEATIAAHFVAAAEKAGWSADEINAHLKQIVATTTLSEFWITDSNGHAYLRNQDGIDFTFSSDAAKNPQSAVFYQLITGKEKVIIQAAAKRDYDGKSFKYVGVGGVDEPRIVQVGYEASLLDALRERVSMDRLSQELVAGGDIRAIRVVDASYKTTVFQSAAGLSPDISDSELAVIKDVLVKGQGQSYLDGNFLKVIEPIRGIDANGPTSGAVILYLPTDRLQAAIQRQVTQAVAAALAILLIGVVMSSIMAHTITQPLTAFRRAAASVQTGSYQPGLLADVLLRRDELGALGRVFDQMARDVGARDRRFNLLRVIIPIGVALSAEKDFSRLLETIVVEAQRITNADAGSLYLRTDDNMLKFVIVRNETLNVALGGTTGREVTLQPIPLFDEQGNPDNSHLASYSALSGKRVVLEDAYATTEFDLSGTRAFDAQTGYHSKSFLTMPLKDASDNVIGVLQLINAKDPITKEVVPFQDDEVLDSLVLITTAALSAYIREETLRTEINKLRIEIDQSKQNKQVDEIAESDYFKNLQAQAEEMKKRRKS